MRLNPSYNINKKENCGGPFWDYGLGCLLPHYHPKVLGKRVRTDPIATHLEPACVQTKAPLLKLWSHAHGKWNCYKRVTAGKYNITTIKDKRSLLVKTSKGFPKRAAQQ